ncbi:hypothetical protein [Azospirillum argentinense]|uniref:hypothetical protein n=1 Tax=Azospirillum argentinense TaxID=2970906 RepID=UPI0032DF47E2
MTTDEFRAWKRRHGLSNNSASVLFGMAPRIVSGYAAGQQPIPPVFAAACQAYDHGWRPTRDRAGQCIPVEPFRSFGLRILVEAAAWGYQRGWRPAA